MLIPVLWALDALRMWQLLVLQFAIGIFTVLFDVAYQSYLPALVDREELIDGNSKLQLTVSVAQVAGPSASGGLIAAITAPYAIVLDAASFVDLGDLHAPDPQAGDEPGAGRRARRSRGCGRR